MGPELGYFLMWIVDCWKKTLVSKNKDGLKLQEFGQWGHFNNMIEDGWLVRIKKGYEVKNGKTELGFHFRDSIIADIVVGSLRAPSVLIRCS